ncbi:MAG TPA: N-6 DNA methylase [Plasticicumulans sp.]|nr:N-6 DNA methylase [Plasticicumulans sp.]
MFPVPGEYLRRNNPNRLIFPEAVEAGRWRSLAERAAALPEDWQRSILQVTQYQHFTSENMIRSIWSALQRIGFTGGKVFEPGTGIGSFRMLMPESVASTSKFTGIEFDGPTALIARLLSPEQNMLHGDFIKHRLPDDYFDVVIGNPPFSQTQVLADPRYQKHGFTLHDFFFAKSLDKLRPGGVLAFVTSKGTMDKKSDRARRYLADRADLLGAVRLPSTAFEGNAGTSVVTDVIFLRKRAPGDAEGGLPWRDVRAVETKDGPVIINEYFADNPDMVLGQNRISGNTDDEGRRINSNGMGGEKYTVVSYDKTPAELDARFARAVESLPEAVYRPHGQDAQSLRTETAKADFDPAVKREGVVYVKDGELMRVKDGVGVPLSGLLPKLSAKDTAWLKDYSGVRDLVREAQHAQITDGEWQDALKRLNAAYDDFVSKHGRFTAFRLITRKSTDEDGNVIEKQSRVYINRRLMIEDYDSPIVTQLESIDDDGVISKGPFLKGRSINAPKPRDVRTIGDALAVSLDEIGRLDLDDIARRLRISRDDAIDALGDQVFRTPQGEMQMADEYLSGNVVEKLAEAVEAARLDDSLRRNVEALEKAQPERLGPSQIGVKLGASWVPAEHVNEFASMIGAGYVTFDPKTESWAVEGGNKRSDRKVGAEYGTAARSPSELLEALLNSRSIKVMKTVPSDTGKGTKNVVDAEATTAANEMAGKIKSAFKSWVWTDSERAAALVETYNERFNNIAGRRFDGSHLTLPGVSLRFKMHAHQLRAIWRQIVSGNTYLAHAVGAGKTIEMIAGAMEQKRIGLIRKPMFVVPNHMLEQFANEFMELYPLANIMVADDKNFSAERRKEFTAAAALNNPDAIVITQSAFERVGVKEESIKPIRDEILDDLEDELRRTAKDNESRVRRSQLEQQIEATKQRFDSILSVGQKDNVIPFEDLGVDMLYVDEAHAYRKLDFHTAQQIKGIDPNGSRRALDMYVKTRVLDRARPGRSFVFASGTPVTNTMGELYTVMRFFAPDTLDRDGTATFDSWARAYGDVVPALEQNASGKYEVVDRFARFENVPELMARVRQFMDVLQSEHLGAVVERPDIEGGKPQLIIVEPTAALKQYQEGPLSMRLATSRAWKPSFNEPNNPDPVLAIITDGRFAATDPRFIPGGEVRPGETTKMDRAADEIIAEYRATSGNVYVDRDGKPMPVKGGTQIVFYNVGFGAASGKKRGFDARAAFTRRLVAGGIARDQIAWFDDADTDAKKEAIFKAMRAGTLRVLIGSAKKMGTGVNVQNRLTALHYMDPPWYPSDVEQPHGRIIRQRNQNKVVRIKWYATKGGYDATMWQMVGRKQRFIDQAFSGDKTLRSMDDLGESSQYEQAAALASGDPRALQLAGLRQDVERLERLHSAHANEQIEAKSALAEAERGEKNAASRIEIYRQMLKVIGGEHFTFKGGSVGRQSFDRYGEFGDAVKVAFNNLVREEASSPTQDEHQLATVGNGLKIIAIHDWQPGNDKEVGVRRLMPTGWFDVSVDVAGRSLSVGRYRGMGEDVDGTGLTRRIVNVINSVDADLRAAESERQSRKEDVARLRKKVGAPFEHYAEMLDKHAALKELEEELRNGGAAAAQQAAAEVQPEGDTPDPGPETRFSRGAAVATPGTRGMPVSQVRRLANNLARTLGINPDSIVVHETTPDFLSGAGRVKGATDTGTGTVHLIASNLTGADDALATLRHELIGHRGLRGVLRGAAWHNVMRATLAARGRDAAITRAMDAALRKEFGARAGAEQATFDGLDAAGRELLAEETIARAAEADVRTPVWQRIVGMILRGLRAVGLWRGAMNETEMRALLQAAQRGLRRQGQGRAERDGGADGLRYRRTATGNATLDAFYEKAGLGVGDGTVFERAQAAKAAALRSVGSRAWWAQRKDEAVQAMIDRFHGIKIAQREAHPGGLSPEQDGYISTRLTTSIGGVVDAVLLDGAPRWKDGILQKIDGSKGLLEALAPVGERIDQWLGWMVARRAQRLMGEGREHNFTADEIDAGLKLARGHEAEFQKAADDYAKLKSAILDVAEQSGLIAGADRATWDNLDYIPFYRMDDEGKALAMARGKRGIANQVSGIRRLMGGEQGLNDPLDNIIRNFASLLDRSAKNAAMDLTMRNLAGTRFVTPVPSTRFTKALVPLDQFRKMLRDAGTDMDAVPDAVLRGVQKVWALEAPTDEDVVSVMRDGRKEYFRVNDPLLLRSLTSLRESPMRSIALDIARGAKNVLTHAVTVTPAFQLRNFIRDSAHSWIVGGKEFKPFDSIKGLSDALRNTGLAQSMKFAGASFEAGAFGDYDASVVAKHVRRRLGADKAGPFMATVHRLGDVWEKYRDFRGAVENANREAVAKATLRETGSMKAAMFAAKDAMDFSMRGDSMALRMLTDTVPFLNARIQGLYKLGRSANMGSFAARAALMTVASLALLAWNRDDERWKRLEDWDRWGFWHFWLGDTHMRVPKPFEVGLLFSTWPEAAAQSMMGDDRRFWAAIRHGVQDTLRVDMPQLIGPAYEVATNEDRYTGRPVENLADQGKASSLRYSSRTSDTARALGQAEVFGSRLSDATGLSPKELEHLFSGYFGEVGRWALDASDALVRAWSDAPAKPDMRVRDVPLVGSLVASVVGGGADAPSKYATRVYEAIRDSEAAYKSLRTMAQQGEPAAKIADFRRAHAEELAAYRALNRVQERDGEMRKMQENIRLSRTISPDAKRARVDAIEVRRQELMRSTYLNRVAALGY